MSILTSGNSFPLTIDGPRQNVYESPSMAKFKFPSHLENVWFDLHWAEIKPNFCIGNHLSHIFHCILNEIQQSPGKLVLQQNLNSLRNSTILRIVEVMSTNSKVILCHVETYFICISIFGQKNQTTGGVGKNQQKIDKANWIRLVDGN